MLSQAAPTTNITGLGTVVGTVYGRDVAWYRGIPYAEAPVGKLRFQPPQPHKPWSTPLQATKFGSACMQKSASHMSEDCLFLNVATPVNPAPAKLPVMIWIHGGSYVSGSSTLYHNEVLVAMSNLSVVCVTVNYRLGAYSRPVASHRVHTSYISTQAYSAFSAARTCRRRLPTAAPATSGSPTSA